MRIRIATTTSTRIRLAGWLTLALCVLPCVAGAAPKHPRTRKPTTAAQERFIADCVHERTGPTDGITVREALKLCTGIVRHQGKIAKAKARAAKAIEACSQAVVDACVDAAADDGSTDCEAPALRASCTEGK